MLIDNPQVLVDEGWTLFVPGHVTDKHQAACTYPKRDKHWDHEPVAWIELLGGEFTADQFRKWELLKPHQHAESTLNWYLWIWHPGENHWVPKMKRTRDIINDL
jgi:hypothetical protein